MLSFPHPGPVNTRETLRIAVAAAKEYGCGTLVVASNTGRSLEELDFAAAEGLRIVCVTHAYGFVEPGVCEMSDETRAELTAKGVLVCTCGHALSGGERGLSRQFHGYGPLEIISASLRMLGQGTKVAVECATMATDCGFVTPGVPIVAVGGTGRGSDTALILRSAHANAILATKIDRILCKPIP